MNAMNINIWDNDSISYGIIYIQKVSVFKHIVDILNFEFWNFIDMYSFCVAMYTNYCIKQKDFA